ncbi:MAG: diguanylate cyclase domain-containing protein [Planctomycetota bacterium]
MIGEFGSSGLVLSLLAAALLGPLVPLLIALRDRQRLTARLTNLEDVLRRMRTTETGGQFDERPDETPLQLSRERLVLQNLLDRFPEVTQKFVLVSSLEELGQVLLSAFERVLDTTFGAVFVREGDELRAIARMGLDETECPRELSIRIGRDRIGYAAQKCLILRATDFSALDAEDRSRIEASRIFPREFDFYIPLVHRNRAIGCVAVGGMKKGIQKAHTVCMALANLGALVITNIQRATEIRALSEEDPLTRLSNRRHFYQRLAERLAERNASPFALFLFDIDHFKRINDHHGHAVGDEVLIRVAEETRRFVHHDEREFACRFGGEEFLCVLGCADVASLAARLEAFRRSITLLKVPVQPDAQPPAVRVSGGVAFCPAEEEDADALIRLADYRLYAAKQSGRDRILFESMPSPVTP